MKRREIISGLFELLKPLLHIMCITISLGVLGYICAAAVTVCGIMLILCALGEVGYAAKSLIVIMVLAALLRGAARYAEQRSGHYIAFRELAIIRDKVYTVLRRLAPAKLAERGQGDLCSMVTSDIEQLEVFYAHTVAPVAIAVIVSVLAAVYIGTKGVAMAVTAAAAYVTVGAIIPLASSKIGKASGKASRERLADLNNFYLESLRGMEVSLQYGNAEKRRKESESKTKELLREQRIIKRHEGMAAALTGAAVIAFTVLCFAAGVLSGAEFHECLVSAAVLSATFAPVIALSNLSATLTQTFASGERVLSLLKEDAAVEEIKEGLKPEFEGAGLENVCFAYGSEPVLKNVSLSIEKGSITGLTGKSGCGKSTALRLLMRFWESDCGRVRISDCDINEIESRHLIDLEGFMTQTTELFKASIAENIKIAKPDATDEELRRACEKAALIELVDSLDEGLDTDIGELGESLSAGERQRIGLARAFLHDAPFLLLDEPTANLDALNEGAILKSVKEEGGRTVVISSHRPSTLMICDSLFDVERNVMKQ